MIFMFRSFINKFLSLIVYFIFSALVILFSYYSFIREKEYIYKEIDHNILAVAQSLPMLLSNDFHDRATSPNSITNQEFKANMEKLSQMAKSFKVDYVYTCIKRNNTMFITSGNATDNEIKTGVNLIHYYDPYIEATPSMLNVFDTGKILFVENTDHWGTFRNVLVPMKSPNGSIYMSGVSVSLYRIQQHLRERFIEHLIFGIGFLIISLPIFLWRHRRISRLAYYDSLTQLPNRHAFQKLASSTLNLCKRNDRQLALMFLDLDGFKTINDTLGHSIGDKLLIKVSKRLLTVLRDSDIPSRQGGDEFVIALPNTNIDGASFVAEKILEEIAKPYVIDKYTLNVTFSIGIAIFPNDGNDLENLSKKADIAMYEAKKAGRNRFSISGIIEQAYFI